MAVNRVERLLRKVSQALDKAKIPYAVIGGNAIAICSRKSRYGCESNS